MDGRAARHKPRKEIPMKNEGTERWIRVKTTCGNLWIDPQQKQRAESKGRKFILSWKRKDSEPLAIHIENIRYKRQRK
jgi:hypothetical protein